MKEQRLTSALHRASQKDESLLDEKVQLTYLVKAREDASKVEQDLQRDDLRVSRRDTIVGAARSPDGLAQISATRPPSYNGYDAEKPGLQPTDDQLEQFISAPVRVRPPQSDAIFIGAAVMSSKLQTTAPTTRSAEAVAGQMSLTKRKRRLEARLANCATAVERLAFTLVQARANLHSDNGVQVHHVARSLRSAKRAINELVQTELEAESESATSDDQGSQRYGISQSHQRLSSVTYRSSTYNASRKTVETRTAAVTHRTSVDFSPEDAPPLIENGGLVSQRRRSHSRGPGQEKQRETTWSIKEVSSQIEKVAPSADRTASYEDRGIPPEIAPSVPGIARTLRRVKPKLTLSTPDVHGQVVGHSNLLQPPSKLPIVPTFPALTWESQSRSSSYGYSVDPSSEGVACERGKPETGKTVKAAQKASICKADMATAHSAAGESPAGPGPKSPLNINPDILSRLKAFHSARSSPRDPLATRAVLGTAGPVRSQGGQALTPRKQDAPVKAAMGLSEKRRGPRSLSGSRLPPGVSEAQSEVRRKPGMTLGGASRFGHVDDKAAHGPVLEGTDPQSDENEQNDLTTVPKRSRSRSRQDTYASDRSQSRSSSRSLSCSEESWDGALGKEIDSPVPASRARVAGAGFEGFAAGAKPSPKEQESLGTISKPTEISDMVAQWTANQDGLRAMPELSKPAQVEQRASSYVFPWAGLHIPKETHGASMSDVETSDETEMSEDEAEEEQDAIDELVRRWTTVKP